MECQFKLQCLQFNFERFANYYYYKKAKQYIDTPFELLENIEYNDQTGEPIMDFSQLDKYLRWIKKEANVPIYQEIFDEAFKIYNERIYEKKYITEEAKDINGNIILDQYGEPLRKQVYKKTGEKKFKINSHYKIPRTKWKRDGNLESFYDWIEIPCGRCPMCRENLANEWATKSWMEMQYHENSCFLTLTYDNKHLPHVENNKNRPSTVPEYKEVWPKFMRSLRDHYKDKGMENLKFLVCSEYGPKTKRAHLHAIIFGLWPDDAKPCKRISKSKHPMWDSEWLQNQWNNGIVKVGIANVKSAAYVAQYTAKKLGKEETVTKGRRPEWLKASNRPGLGTPYWIENKETILANSAVLYNGFTHPIPRLFLRRFEREDPKNYWEWYYRNKVRAEERNNEKYNKIMEEGAEHYQKRMINKFNEKIKKRVRNDL